MPRADKTVASTYSNVEGEYQFINEDQGLFLPQGFYSIILSKEGYESTGIDNFQLIGNFTQIKDFKLFAYSSYISGIVTDGTTEISNATVKAIHNIFNEQFSTLTDENGNFHLTSLPPGDYYINAFKNGFCSLADTLVTASITGLILTISQNIGFISGDVIDSITNYPVAGVTLNANDGHGYFGKAVSDDNGHFVISDLATSYNYTVNANKVVVIPPGGKIFLDDYLKRKTLPKVVYSGIVSYRKHVDLFINSIPYVKRMFSDTEFFITNKGDLLNSIKKLAENLNINPTYFWFEDLEKLLVFLSTCHIGILTSTNDVAARMSMPSKLFDYLSVGLPVVANDVGGWTEIIKENNVGRVTSDDPKDFAQNILELLNDPQELEQIGRKGIQLIKSVYNWDVSASLLKDAYKKLVNH